MTDDEQDKKNVLSNFKGSRPKVVPSKKCDKDSSVDVGVHDSKLVKEPLHPDLTSGVAMALAETDKPHPDLTSGAAKALAGLDKHYPDLTSGVAKALAGLDKHYPDLTSGVAKALVEIEQNNKRVETFKAAAIDVPLSEEMKRIIDIQEGSPSFVDDERLTDILGISYTLGNDKTLSGNLGIRQHLANEPKAFNDLRNLDRKLIETRRLSNIHIPTGLSNRHHLQSSQKQEKQQKQIAGLSQTVPVVPTQPSKREVVEEQTNDENISTNPETIDEKKSDHRFMSDEDVLEYAKDYKIKCNSGKQETLKIPQKADSRYSDYFMLKSLEESKLIHLTMEPITTGEHSGKVEVTELRLTIAGGEKLEAYLARTPLRRIMNSMWENIWKILIGVVVAGIILIFKSNFIDNYSDSSINAPPVQQSESISSESPAVLQKTPPPATQ